MNQNHQDANRYQQIYSLLEAEAPLYAAPWWLEAATGQTSTLRYLISQDSGTPPVVATLFEPVSGYLEVPPFCQYSGLWGYRPPRKEEAYNRTQYATTLATHEQIAQQLSHYPVWSLHLQPGDLNWLPYYAIGATATPYLTHLLPLSQEVKQVQAKYNSHLKRKLVKFKKENPHAHVAPASIHDLLQCVSRTMERVGIPHWGASALGRLAQAATQHSQGTVWGVWTDASMQTDPLAVAFVAHTSHTAYYMAGGRDHQNSQASNALAFLLDRIIEQCCKQGLTTFDFEGSMQSGIAFFFRSFGAEPIPYLRIKKGSLGINKRLQRKLYYTRHIF